MIIKLFLIPYMNFSILNILNFKIIKKNNYPKKKNYNFKSEDK